MTVPMVVGGFGLGICAGAVVLARVAQRTDGSVLAAALWHAGYNMTSATAASRAVIAAVTTTAVMLWAVALLIGAGRHGGRTTLFVETRNNEGALPRRFKQFERIAVRILNLNLASAGTGLHVISKDDAIMLQGGDTAGEIRDSQYDAVPPPGLLTLTARHRP
jgi:hypothetical protein